MGEHLIGFRYIFKIIGKDHQCRCITPSVSRETASRIHEEMCGGASGKSAVNQIGLGCLGKFVQRTIE
jgi:hypothetical protein